MKNKSPFVAKIALLVIILFSNVLILNAQNSPGTKDDDFLLRILSPPNITQDLKNGNDGSNCGWIGAFFGPSLLKDICGEVVWAYDETPDSMCCDPIPQDLTGKIALIRRGGSCSFSLKVYRAQQAGAKAVIIANHYFNNSIGDGPCATYFAPNILLTNMASADSATAVTIPSIFIQRQTAESIDAALTAGETVEVCFALPRVKNPYAGNHYATPVSQIRVLENIGFRFFNREDTIISGLVIKADIHEPGGNITTLTSNVPPLEAGKDTLLFFSPYTPPAVIGNFEIVYSNNKYTEPRDTLRRKFVQTEYTWAMDNFTLNLDEIRLHDYDVFPGTLKYQVGGLIFTGNSSFEAQYVTFGIANIDSIYDPNNPNANWANWVTILLYDADSDGNGKLNLLGDFEVDLGGDILAIGEYKMTGLEKEDEMIDALLIDFNSPGDSGATLQPNHPYLITLLYDGEPNGTGRNCDFSKTAYEDYLFHQNEALQLIPCTPIKLGTYFGYWGDRTVITRLHNERLFPIYQANDVLNAEKYTVTPNPANENLRLNLDLAGQNSQIKVSIISGLGRTLRSQLLKNFQNGQINFDVRDIPSGVYLMQIQTEEGRATTKVSICH